MNQNNETKGMKGVFIPIEIFENANLNLAEKLLYGVVWYYSTYGNGCRIYADNLGKKLDASERTIKRYRQHLKELNLVRSEGYGEKTVYYTNDPKSDTKVDTTINNDNEEDTSSECTKVDPKSDTKVDNDSDNTPLRVTGDTDLRDTGDTHNKEINKEEKNSIMNGIMNVQSLDQKETVDIMENVQSPYGTGETFYHFFHCTFEGGWNIDLLEHVRDSDNRRKAIWDAWRIFIDKLPNISKTFEDVAVYYKTFRYLIGKEYDMENEKTTETLKKMNDTYTSILKAYFINRWNDFLLMLNDTEPIECKKTRYAFYDKAKEVFKGEEYNKVRSTMELEYIKAYSMTGRLDNLKPEDLDPDLQTSEATNELSISR